MPPALRPLLLRPAFLFRSRWSWKGFLRWRQCTGWRNTPRFEVPAPENPLLTFFENRQKGRGIFKWRHYFEMYDRHFGHFRKREVNVLEIGVYSGGSLEMWRDYFGNQSHIYGVDIRPECKAYEGPSIAISIGDQADRNFWKGFKATTPYLDVVIDDGGHRSEQQIVSFEELFPFLRPGGIYICEDLGGTFNEFIMYVQGLVHNLNSAERVTGNENSRERRQICTTNSFQSAVASLHFYPFAVVIERTNTPVAELISSMHGSDWLPHN